MAQLHRLPGIVISSSGRQGRSAQGQRTAAHSYRLILRSTRLQGGWPICMIGNRQSVVGELQALDCFSRAGSGAFRETASSAGFVVLHLAKCDQKSPPLLCLTLMVGSRAAKPGSNTDSTKSGVSICTTSSLLQLALSLSSNARI